MIFGCVDCGNFDVEGYRVFAGILDVGGGLGVGVARGGGVGLRASGGSGGACSGGRWRGVTSIRVADVG